MKWPTRTIRYGSRPQVVRGEESGLVGGYNMIPENGVLADESGLGKDGAAGARSVVEHCILGPFRKYVSGASKGSILGAADDFPLTSVTMEFWVRGVAEGERAWCTNYFEDTSDGWGIAIESDMIYVVDDIDNVDTVRYTTAWINDKLTHVVAQMRTDKENLLYIDGHLVGSGEYSSDLWNSIAGELVHGDRSGNGDFCPDNGIVGPIRIYDEAKSQQWVTRRYLEGARAIQLATGWGFHETISNYTAGDYVEPGDGLRVVSGEWAVEVDTINGADAKVLSCKADGQIWIPACYFFATAAEQAYGTWKAWLKKAEASEMQIYTVTDAQAPTAGYALKWAADEAVTIEETGVGTVVGGGSASADTWHELAMTRRYDGLFEGFVDRASFGTADDDTTQESEGILIEADAGDAIALSDPRGNHCLSKQLGVTI